MLNSILLKCISLYGLIVFLTFIFYLGVLLTNVKLNNILIILFSPFLLLTKKGRSKLTHLLKGK